MPTFNITGTIKRNFDYTIEAESEDEAVDMAYDRAKCDTKSYPNIEYNEIREEKE